MLDRDAAMRAFVTHRRHEPGLAIAPLDSANVRPPTQRRFLSIGCRDDTRRKPSPIGEDRDRGKGRSLDGTDTEPGEERQARKRSSTFD